MAPLTKITVKQLETVDLNMLQLMNIMNMHDVVISGSVNVSELVFFSETE